MNFPNRLNPDRMSSKGRLAEVTRILAVIRRRARPPARARGGRGEAAVAVMGAGWPTATIDRNRCAIISWEVGAILGATR
jgi:hypothetical protein